MKNLKKISKNKIKTGDLFAFELVSEEYMYGRILHQTILGSICLLYDIKTKDFNIQIDLNEQEFIYPPLIVDTITLFVDKSEGNWGILRNDPFFKIPNSVGEYGFIIGEKFLNPLDGKIYDLDNCNKIINNLTPVIFTDDLVQELVKDL